MNETLEFALRLLGELPVLILGFAWGFTVALTAIPDRFRKRAEYWQERAERAELNVEIAMIALRANGCSMPVRLRSKVRLED